MRVALSVLMVLSSGPAVAQVSIDSTGVRSGGVRIDASRIHSGNKSVTRNGVIASREKGTTINGNGGVREIDCAGGSLTVNGNRNRITTAHCRTVTLTGNNNQLRWRAATGRPAITNVGNRNSISRL